MPLSLDPVAAIIFVITVVLIIYDRLTLVKKHEEIIAELRKMLLTLEDKVELLSLALNSVATEFHTYRELTIKK